MRRCFDKPSVVSYKRHKNIRDLLVRAKLPPKRGPRRIINGLKNCGELCKLCILSPKDTTKSHTCKRTAASYTINSPINCKTDGVIYKILCSKCPYFVYIGETGKSVKQRFSQHFGDAERKDLTKPCGRHFCLPGHSVANMIAFAFEQVFPKNDTLLRKRRETHWINLYQCVDFGANSRSLKINHNESPSSYSLLLVTP